MVEVIRRLIVAGLAVGAIAGNADEITRFYDETVAHARHLATAADIRSISNMLDYEFLRKGRYPGSDKFTDWMRSRFKENNLQELGLDHWGNRMIYKTDPECRSFTLVSKGPDGLAGTSDDLKATGP